MLAIENHEYASLCAVANLFENILNSDSVSALSTDTLKAMHTIINSIHYVIHAPDVIAYDSNGEWDDNNENDNSTCMTDDFDEDEDSDEDKDCNETTVQDAFNCFLSSLKDYLNTTK